MHRSTSLLKLLTALLLLLLCGCTRVNTFSELEEEAYWNRQVFDSAHNVLYTGKQLAPALAVVDYGLMKTGRKSHYATIMRYVIICNYLHFFTENKEALSHYIDSALLVIADNKLEQTYPRQLVSLLLFGGETAFKLHNYNKANQYFFRAKQSSDAFFDPCARSSYTYHVAMVSYRQQNFRQSATYFKEAFAAQATCPVQTSAIALQQQEIQSNIGLCMMELKQYDSALYHFNYAERIAEAYKDSLGPIAIDRIKGVLYGHKAMLLALENNLPEAEELFEKSIALNDRPNYEQRHAMLMKLDLADVYYRQQRLQDMYAVLQQVRNSLDEAPDNEAEAEWRYLQYQYFQKLPHPIEELAAFKSYIALRDSMAQKQKALTEADITRQLNQKEQELQIALLKKNNELQTIYLWVAIAAAGMGAFIMSLVFYNYRRSRKNVAHLTRLNEQINRQKTDLENANNEKDRILQVVAHDLRSPVGLTAYVADLAMLEEPKEKERNYLLMIKESAQQALYLINELLGLQNRERITNAPETAELVTVVQQAAQMLQYKAAEKGQQLTIQTETEMLPVRGNAEKLNRVVSNLLNNAIKFSPLQETIQLKIKQQNGQALFSITNNGRGIPKHQQQSVFERFTPARSQGTSGEKSFGLGLSICKEIVESMGGSISLDSQVQKGTTFYVSLPLADNV